jgi:hypothetical protein
MVLVCLAGVNNYLPLQVNNSQKYVKKMTFASEKPFFFRIFAKKCDIS